MHSLFGKRSVLFAGILALAVAAVTPQPAAAGPEPGAKPRGFRLFARSLGAITINRIYCGLSTTGEVCVDSTNSSTIGGGYWPKGTANGYVFNSGLQLAGIIGEDGGPWAGDTTGAFFFDPKGTTQHGLQVEPIYNSTNPDDVANWPAGAFVPSGDASANIFNPLLQGRVAASQGDVWWLSWEGSPTQNAGRSHPTGIVVESRGMGWNFPAGNEDILYFVYTFYNVTSLEPADYASIRPGLRETMISRAQQFHQLNNAAFGVDLPDGGYTINNLFAAFGADMDVTNASSSNYSSVILPFALGHTYLEDFSRPPEFTFDPGIFAPPFFEGSGLVGVKYLQSPTGAGEIQLFSNTIRQGSFDDAANTTQLYRYLSGTLDPAFGDAPCNTGDPSETRICFINNGNPADMRFFQSSTPLTLGPGEFGSIVVAYIFAAPYKPASYTAPLRVRPGQAVRTNSVDSLTNPSIGANMIDSIAGLLSYSDGNGNGIAEQAEFVVATNSLLGKAKVAQAVFDTKFLLPFAPDAPEFFLVPGDDQVTVLWRPSASETTGDPFFQIAGSATVVPEGGGDPVPNPLYDPNYREFDVEGYRVYRGRVDSPGSLTLLAQFDYAGTSILDYQGQINPTVGCAPELNLFDDCAAAYDPAEFAPGVARTIANEIPLFGPITQVTVPGSRALLGTGVIDTVVASIDSLTDPLNPDTTFQVVFVSNATIILKADTALTGLEAGYPPLQDTGVPFAYVDHGVRNNFRYFYAVTAFDINSFQSGPSSIESARITKAVTPRASASNASFGLVTENQVFGRGVALTDNTLPTLDPVTGVFNKAFPPSDGWALEFTGYVAQLVSGPGSIAVRLDSIQPGSAYNDVLGNYFATVQPGTPAESQIVLPLKMGNTGSGPVDTNSVTFAGGAVNPQQAQNFGVATDFVLGASLTGFMPADYWMTVQSRGCVNSAEGFTNAAEENECSYNGARWFEGTTETAPHPTAGNEEVNSFGFAAGLVENYNNAGVLPGVTTVYEARSYTTTQTTWRNVEGIIGFSARAADLRVYWGAGGVVDSVIDITHNVPVPFDTAAVGSWGFMNASNSAGAGSDDARPGVVSLFDMGCVWPIRRFSTIISCTAGTEYNLSPVAELSPIILVAGSPMSAQAARPADGNGFIMYIAGHIFTFEMDALPADGTVWTMRGYTGGGLIGGQGSAGDEGPYEYHQIYRRPFTAVGAEIHLEFEATNELALPTLANLDEVHTVPDPYYVTNEFEQTSDNKVIKFVNLPNAATIRIYSSSGVLIDVIEHNSISGDATATWNVRNRNNQVVASGVYFYHIEAGDARRVGRFTVVNFAQ